MSVTPVERLGHDAIEEKGWLGAHHWLLLRRACQLGILALFLVGPWFGIWIGQQFRRPPLATHFLIAAFVADLSVFPEPTPSLPVAPQ